MTKRNQTVDRRSPFILGLGAFARIGAVEGVRLDSCGKKMFADFERRGLTAAERRRAIHEKHAKKA
jgi:hypothetical protein